MSRDWEKRSVRKLDPALVTTVAGHIGRISDLLRDVVEHPAASHGAVVVYEGLTADHLDPPLPPEILTGDAAPLLKINEFEHDSMLLGFLKFKFT